MKLETTTFEQIEELVMISKAAFDDDIKIGAPEIGGPPEYDSVDWHVQMMKEGPLLTALENGSMIGGAVVFINENRLQIGRIFLHPKYHRKGYGIALMNCLVTEFSGCTVVSLDTPIWNRRTNAFYCKLGYSEVNRDHECIYYEKRLKK